MNTVRRAAPPLLRLLAGGEAEWLAGGVVQRGPLAAAAAALRGRAPVLAIDGPELTLHACPRPSRRRAECLRALPYALEEALIDDPEILHFATGPLSAEPLAVAVIARATLDALLARCAGVGLAPVSVVPAVLLLPMAPPAWTLALDDTQALLRTGAWSGLACTREELPWVLERAVAQASVEAADAAPAAARRLHVYGEADGLVPAGYVCQPQPGGLLEACAAGRRRGAGIELLDASLRPAEARAGRRAWAAFAAACVVWTGVQLGLAWDERARLAAELAGLEAAQTSLLRAAVPGVRRIVNARLQLEQALRERGATAGAGGGDALALLAGVAPALAAGTADDAAVPVPRALRWHDGRLDLELAGGDLAAADALRARLDALPGLAVAVQTALADGRVELRVTVTPAPVATPSAAGAAARR